MTRLEELTLNCVDDCLTLAEEGELGGLVQGGAEAAREHLTLLSIEAALRATRNNFDLSESILVRLQGEQSEAMAAKVLARIEVEPRPNWRHRAIRRPTFPLLNSTRARALGLAAAIVLLLGLGIWFFGPAMGEPVVAGLRGTEIFIERRGRIIPALVGIRLERADLLRIGANGGATIAFGKEKTTIRLDGAAELKLVSTTASKRFELRRGRVEATVARQRLFAPLALVTPQAEARVLGTHFTLVVATNSTTLEVMEGKVRFTRTSDGKHLKIGKGYYAVAEAGYAFVTLPATGRILREYWTNLVNKAIDPSGAVLRSKRSSLTPRDGYGYLARFEAVPVRTNLHVIERIRGYVHPPTNGWYRFALTTVHEETALLLSRTDRPEDVVQVAYRNPEGIGPSLQEVTPVPLKAGHMYYVEVVHESDGGDDHLTVMWQAPGRNPEIIPGEFLSPFAAPKTKDQR
jgi:hypothetical protein